MLFGKKALLMTLVLFSFSSTSLATSLFLIQMDEDKDLKENIISAVTEEPKDDIQKAQNKLKVNYKYDGKDGKPLLLSLCFHEVGYNNDNLSVRPETFRNMLVQLKELGYAFVDANDLVDIKNNKKKMPKKAVFIGFDDGYKDNYVYAYPILKQEGAKATFFIVSNSISTDNRMTYEDLKKMIADGFAIGSHTANHTRLDNISKEDIRKELNDSKYSLQTSLNTKVNSVAYPGGYDNSDVVEVATDIYDIGFTASMDNTDNTNMTIPRYGVFKWHKNIYDVVNNN